MKNKIVIPFNFKVVLLLFICIFWIGGFIWLTIENIKIGEYNRLFIYALIILFLLGGIVVLFIKNIRFKEDFMLIPKEHTMSGPQTEGKVYYNDIKRVAFIKKNEDGPHIVDYSRFGISNKQNTIVIYGKQDATYLISTKYCTKKQIDIIINEIKNRTNLD